SLSARCYENIGRLDVPVYDSSRMRCVERIRDLRSQFEKGIGCDRTAADPLAQSLTFQQLHHQKWSSAGFAHIVNRANSWVIPGPRCPRLALKSLQRRRIACQLLGQKLQRHLPAESRVFGAIYLPHPSGPEGLDNSIVRDRFADHDFYARSILDKS